LDAPQICEVINCSLKTQSDRKTPCPNSDGYGIAMVVEAMGVVLAMMVGAMVFSFAISNFIFLMLLRLMEIPGEVSLVDLITLEIRPCGIVQFSHCILVCYTSCGVLNAFLPLQLVLEFLI